MMQEDQYPIFMKAYRQLRLENIKFPPRDPNERHMIQFEGDPSPMFEVAEMEGAKEEQKGGNQVKRENYSQALPQQFYDQTQQYKEEPPPTFTPADVEELENNVKEIEEVLKKALTYEELLEPHFKNLYKRSKILRNKLVVVASNKTMEGELKNQNETIQLFTVIDFVNTKLTNFRTAILLLRAKANIKEVRLALNGGVEEIEQGNLLDFGEDFLNIDVTSPIQGLQNLDLNATQKKPAGQKQIQNKPQIANMKINPQLQTEKQPQVEQNKQPEEVQQQSAQTQLINMEQDFIDLLDHSEQQKEQMPDLFAFPSNQPQQEQQFQQSQFQQQQFQQQQFQQQQFQTQQLQQWSIKPLAPPPGQQQGGFQFQSSQPKQSKEDLDIFSDFINAQQL